MHQTGCQVSLQENSSTSKQKSEENICNPSWAHTEICECCRKMSFGGVESSSQRNDGPGLLAIFGFKRVKGISESSPACSTSSKISHQISNPTSQISSNKDSNSVYQSDWRPEISTTNKSSVGVIISRRSHLPLSAANIWGITSDIAETANLKLSYIFRHSENSFYVSQSVPCSGICSTLSLGSTSLRHFSLSQIPCKLPSILQRSYWPAFRFISGRSSTSQLGHASRSADDLRLQNETQIEVMRQLMVESALHMHRLADSLLEGSMSLMISTGGDGMNFTLVIEDVQVSSQSPFFYANDTYNHYTDMRLDVDSMSYEELLALEDHIGYVSTGLSEEALTSSLRHSKYSLFTKENALKESCSICQEDCEEEDELGTLDCGHSFHIACIEQWLRCKNICPICKSTGLCTTGASFPQILIM